MDEISRLYAKKPIVKRSNSSLGIQRKKASQPLKSPADRILFLQRTIGNQAVQRLIKSGTLQAKLKIGQPGDKYEQEADRVADAVMRMPEPGVQRQVEPEEEEEKELIQAKPLVNPITPMVQRQVEPEEEEIQTKQLPSQTQEIIPDVETRINSIRGGGQPLPGSARAFFEPRFKHDFSRVRVHTDAKAADTARAVNARAFTVGQDIVYGAGQYAPGTATGRRLLAHELTHVLQQGNATAQRKLTTSKTNNFIERGANEVTLKITTGASHVQRNCTTATGRVIFILYSSGMSSGCTYIRSGAQVDFLNHGTVTHTIRINPTGLFTSSSFLINAGARVIVWASRVSQVTGGSIIDTIGRRETVHDVVICP